MRTVLKTTRHNVESRLQSLIVAMAAVMMLAAIGASAADVTVSVFASGLNNPRGLKFGPDGFLYVAEGGLGGPLTTTPADCEQVPAPIGPYSGGFTASISKISPAGVRTTVVGNLPSSQTSADSGSLASGVADVAFIGDNLYALMAGAGCSHGLLGTTNAILRVNSDGTTTQVADLSAFQKAHPVANPEPDDFEPDGTWYSMVAVRGDLYAVEPNHGEVDRISPETGAISRVVDVSASQGHIVPTTIAYHGNFFFGNLGTFPIVPGTEKVFKLTPSGQLKEWATGFSTVLGLAFDHDGRLYVLESMTAPGFPGPPEFGTGIIVRFEDSGALTMDRFRLDFSDGDDLRPRRRPLRLQHGIRSAHPGVRRDPARHRAELDGSPSWPISLETVFGHDGYRRLPGRVARGG